MGGYASLDENTKIPLSQLPDVILGQMVHAGDVDISTRAANLTTSGKTILGTTSSTIKLTNDTAGTTGYISNQGNYYLVIVSGNFAGISFNVGDWLIANEGGWSKVDNTDEVTGVKGANETTYRIGNVNITAANVGAAPISHVGSKGIAQHDVARWSGNWIPGFSEANFTSALNDKLNGIEIGATANKGTITGVAPGTNITGGGTSGNVTISHETINTAFDGYDVTPNFGGYFQAISELSLINGHVRIENKDNIKIPNTEATATNSGLMSITDKNKLDGISVSPLSNLDWDTIINIINLGIAPALFKVGDEKDITLSTGETLTMQIYGFNHDDLDGGGKAKVTFGTKNLLRDARVFDSTPAIGKSYANTELYQWISGDLYNSLPGNLKSNIKTVLKTQKTAAGTSTAVSSLQMKTFAFSVIELMGAPIPSPDGTASGEGTQYPIFTDNNSRIKRLDNGNSNLASYWTRSLAIGSNNRVGRVDTTGAANSIYIENQAGVCFGFCV